MSEATAAISNPARRSLHERPYRWEMLGVWFIVVLLVAFAVVTEFRSAFLQRPMTDAQVYFRAAWAIRANTDLYGITDDNEWHYHYPPLLAILMAPLADAPAGADRTGLLPYAVSVAVWYLLSVAFLIFAAHHLARAAEECSADPYLRAPPRWSRRWWALRLLPLTACLPAALCTLAHGQVNLLLLAVLCAMAAAFLRRRSGQAGLWLAGAICLKLIPLYLLIYPLWRRDLRCLAGCAAGLFIGFALIPAVVMGPERTWDSYEEWLEVLIRPGLGHGEDQSRAQELTDITTTDSQSFLAILHSLQNPDAATRPHAPTQALRRAHWLIGGLLTLITLFACGRARREEGTAELTFLGSLIILMALLSPVCHFHYFCLVLPLVMALVAAEGAHYPLPALSRRLALLIGMVIITNCLPHLPFASFQPLRNFGFATFGALLLWSGGILLLLRTRPRAPGVALHAPPAAELAA